MNRDERYEEYRGVFSDETFPLDRDDLYDEVRKLWRKGAHRVKPYGGISYPVLWSFGEMPAWYFGMLKSSVIPYIKMSMGREFKLRVQVKDYFSVVSLDFDGWGR